MFFILGISNGEKKLDFIQTIVCPNCGQFGRLEMYMTYMYFSLFFLPIVRWKRKFFVKAACCNRLYEVDPELGKRILKGEEVNLKDTDLHVAGRMGNGPNWCLNCGYPASPEFDFCPKCGCRLS